MTVLRTIVSMRGILLMLTVILLTIVTVTIGLFDRSLQTSTIDTFSYDILELKKQFVTTELNNIFTNAHLLLQSTDSFVNDLDPPAIVTSASLGNKTLIETFPTLYSYLLSQVKQNLQGLIMEFYWYSEQCAGVEAILGTIDAYNFFEVNGTLRVEGHMIPYNGTGGGIISDIQNPE